MIILLSKYNTLCDMFNMIQLQYNMTKIIMYLYLDSPNTAISIFWGKTRVMQKPQKQNKKMHQIAIISGTLRQYDGL